MGITAALSQMPQEIFEKIQGAKIYSTWNFLQENPHLTESDVHSKFTNIYKAWYEINAVFKVKGAPLKFIIEGDYHHPAGIKQGIDSGGYYYEGFVSPESVKGISVLLNDYSPKIILNELKAQSILEAYSLNDLYTKNLLADFQRVFNIYQEASEWNNAIMIMLA